jgi:hypothetical protein
LPSSCSSDPDDRVDHAIEAYSHFHGRECWPIDVYRYLEKDTLLHASDHLLARRVDDRQLRFVGVVSKGITIVDTSEGDPTWAIGKSQGQTQASAIAQRPKLAPRPRGRRLAQLLATLDIPEGSKYQQG